MYCSKCGILIPEKLNYCNSCGAKVAKAEEAEGKVSPLNTLLSTTLPAVVVFGLGILVGLVGVLLKNEVKHDIVAIISIFYLSALFGICFSLTRLMSKLIDINSDKKIEKTETIQTPQLSMPTNPQLNEYQQPIGSVTEHTTRTFDEAFVKRN